MEILSTRMSFCVRLLEVGDEDSPPWGALPCPHMALCSFLKFLAFTTNQQQPKGDQSTQGAGIET